MAAMILSSAIMLTSERVIRTPELLQAIFVFVGLAPAARLARTSRYFFHTIAPILWRDIDGVEVLFALLPGTTIDHTKNEEMWMRVIRLPRSLSDTDLTRFNFYAPFVRSLRVFGTDFTRYDLVHWEWLLEHSEQYPLLPNIHLISLDMQDRFKSEEKTRLPWLLMFISPSLTSFETPPMWSFERKLMAQNVAVCVQTVLSQRCPDLQTLELFAVNDDLMSPQDQAIFDRLVDPSISADIGVLFAESFCSLTHLKSSMSAIDFIGLKLFGSLPATQYLELCFEGVEPGTVKAVDLQPDAFPSLTALHLGKLDCLEDFATLWSIAPLTRKLTSASVQIRNLNWERGEHLAPIYEVARLLCEYAPLVNDLSLRLPGPGDTIDAVKSGLQSLSKLPLEHLLLLTPAIPYGFHHALNPGLFPSLESLITSESISSPDLIYYAKAMPALRNIFAQIIFVVPEDSKEEILGRTGAMRVECHGSSYRARDVSPSGDAIIARSLHSVWSEVKLDTSKCWQKRQAELQPIQDLLQSYQRN